MSEEVSQEGKPLVEIFAPTKKAGRPVGSKNKPKTRPRDVARENELLAEIARLKTKLASKSEYSNAEIDRSQKNIAAVLGIPPGAPGDAPPMPAMEPDMGDKTPAVVEWYREYWPEEYARRYKNRKTHLVAKVRKPKLEDEEEGDDDRKFQITHESGLNTDPRFY